MYKSRFKFGESGPIIVTALFALVLTIGLAINWFKTGRDLRALTFVGPLLIFVTVCLWKKILTEMNHIEITELTIQVKNPFTKRVNLIKKENLKGFKDIFRNGYTILLVDEQENIVAKISDYYYHDFEVLRENLGLDYIGRIPTFWDRIIKIKD